MPYTRFEIAPNGDVVGLKSDRVVRVVQRGDTVLPNYILLMPADLKVGDHFCLNDHDDQIREITKIL